MFRVVALLVLASLLLTALALISCLSVADKREIRGAPRAVWVLAILLLPLAGALAWFLVGRPRPAGATGTGLLPGGRVLPEPPRPRAPDDDPEFLRSLDQPTTLSNEDERLLREWEEDLKRREERQEDEQRRRDPGTET